MQGQRTFKRGGPGSEEKGPSVNQALQQTEGERGLHRWVCGPVEGSGVGSLLVASIRESSAAGEQGEAVLHGEEEARLGLRAPSWPAAKVRFKPSPKLETLASGLPELEKVQGMTFQAEGATKVSITCSAGNRGSDLQIGVAPSLC